MTDMTIKESKKISEALILAIDVETTGLTVGEDKIVELGGVYIKGGWRCGPPFCSKVNPERYIPIDATRIHGIAQEDVAKAPTWQTVSKWLHRHMNEATPILCGYNILAFDAPMINAENQNAGIEWRLDLERILDPFIFCRWYHPEKQSRLGKICSFYGLELPEEAAHSADADSEVTALLATAMVWAGYIPDDLEQAFEQQMRFKAKMESDTRRWGRKLYENRKDPEKLHIASGVYRGQCIDDLEAAYLKRITSEWNSEDMSDEARRYILERTRTQGVLFG
jgi:DNA polymerase III epsilon subunit-like protein